MEATSLGDTALIVRGFGDGLERVLQTMRRIEDAKIPGVVEVTSAYSTVAVFYNPIDVIQAGAPPAAVVQWIAERVRAAAASGNEAKPGDDERIAARQIVIPVCYGGEYGPDLDDVARHAGLSPEEVVRRHSSAEYLIECIGFSPGFPYLSGLPDELAIPRRAVPRKRVPGGAVGIGGSQTGIYPLPSPGGWHLIGRTPLQLFSAKADPPTVLQAGYRVRFRVISAEEFEAWNE